MKKIIVICDVCENQIEDASHRFVNKKIHRRILVIPEGSILRGLVSSGDVLYKDNELLEELKTYPQKRKNRN